MAIYTHKRTGELISVVQGDDGNYISDEEFDRVARLLFEMAYPIDGEESEESA